jgi:AhpD family alkylhydroperoxidase
VTPRFELVDPERAEGPAGELLAELASRGDPPGPMLRAMANAPALLRGYMDLNRAMKRSHLDRRISERVSLAVHEWLRCDYCIAAHTAAAQKLGLSDTDIRLARQGTATDPTVAATIGFALQVLSSPADISDADVDGLRGHGYSDEQISEVVALVALQLLTGAFNLVAGLER